MNGTKNLMYGLLLVFSLSVQAQEENEGGLEVFLHPQRFYHKFFPHLQVKKPETDTAYIKSYPSYMTVGIRWIVPQIDIALNSLNDKSEALNYSSKFSTNIGNIIGVSASYRFITAGFAFVLSSNRNDRQDYAHSSYRTATVKYNGAAYYLQFKYIRTRGFTDINTNNSNGITPYPKREDLVVKEYQFEGLRNFSWKKYSYYAPMDYTQRQLKTRFGFLLKMGAYYTQLSADSNLLAVNQRPYFNDFDDIRIVRSTALKVAPGVALNLVFLKRFYLAWSVFTPYNFCLYNYFTKDEKLVHKGTSIAVVLDGNVCLGYQSERLYAGIRYQADNRRTVFNTVEMTALFSYFGIDFGYRFVAPSIVKTVYQKTMPPGM